MVEGTKNSARGDGVDGVYWKPVWNVLESSKWKFDLLLVNPQQVRALPGKNTDREDGKRICGYLQQGLLRGSFVPAEPMGELRELTRRRTHLQGDRNRVISRIGRLLETANIKLGSVISNIVGQSGKAILNAICSGESKGTALAQLTSGRLKCSTQDIERALEGRYDVHLRWSLCQFLDDLKSPDQREVIARLCTLPGVDATTAHTILAEIGTDMAQFPDARPLASWAGLCPGNSESAGKRFSGRTRKGDRYLRRILIQNAWAVAHMKDCALIALFYRVAGCGQDAKRVAARVPPRRTGERRACFLRGLSAWRGRFIHAWSDWGWRSRTFCARTSANAGRPTFSSGCPSCFYGAAEVCLTLHKRQEGVVTSRLTTVTRCSLAPSNSPVLIKTRKRRIPG